MNKGWYPLCITLAPLTGTKIISNTHIDKLSCRKTGLEMGPELSAFLVRALALKGLALVTTASRDILPTTAWCENTEMALKKTPPPKNGQQMSKCTSGERQSLLIRPSMLNTFKSNRGIKEPGYTLVSCQRGDGQSVFDWDCQEGSLQTYGLPSKRKRGGRGDNAQGATVF